MIDPGKLLYDEEDDYSEFEKYRKNIKNQLIQFFMAIATLIFILILAIYPIITRYYFTFDKTSFIMIYIYTAMITILSIHLYLGYKSMLALRVYENGFDLKQEFYKKDKLIPIEKIDNVIIDKNSKRIEFKVKGHYKPIIIYKKHNYGWKSFIDVLNRLNISFEIVNK